MADAMMTETEARETMLFEDALAANTPKVFVTYFLIAVNLAVFIAMVATGASFFDPSLDTLVRWGADFAPLTLHGQAWRLLTAAFVHIGFMHVLMNMYILLCAGVLTERIFGNIGFAVLYLLAGIGGNLLSVACQPHTVAAGASGAVFGVYGGLLGFLLIQRNALPSHKVAAIGKGAAIFLGFNIYYGFTHDHVDVAAHFGGFITGFLAGCALAQPFAISLPVRLRRIAIVGSAGLALTTVFAIALPAGNATEAEWIRQTTTAPSITVGAKDVLSYSGAATRLDAESLAKALKDDGFFQDKGVQILFTKGRDGATVAFEAKEGMWDDAAYVSALDQFAREIAPAAGGFPMRVRLFNSAGQLKKEVIAK